MTVMAHPAVAREYAAYTNQGFLLQETTLVAKRLFTRTPLDAIKREVMEADLFQLQSLQSRKTIFGAVRDRLEGVPDELLSFLAEGSLELRKLTNLYLILLRHRLLREFLAELVWEELLGFSRTLSLADVSAFFERKRSQEPEIASWSEATLHKSRHNILTVCSDAGLLDKSSASSFEIRPQFIPSGLRDELFKAGRASFLPLLLDGSSL
jgi:hypothetical protein